MSRALITVYIFGLFLTSFAATNISIDNRVDPKIAEHFQLAVNARQVGDQAKILAETSLILLNTPTSVYFDMDGVEVPYDKKYLDAARSGLQLWNTAMPGTPLFTEAKTAAGAQVIVHFQDLLEMDGKRICGHVFWRRSMHWKTDANEYQTVLSGEIKVAMRARPNGEWHEISSIQHIVAHELGHILGLNDSAIYTDIMGPDVHGRSVTVLSIDELNSFKQLRTECLKLRGSALARMKRWQDAELAYRNALAIVPDDSGVRKELSLATQRLIQPSD
jgi:hypothetical protein